MDSPYWAKGPSAKSSEETGAETIYFISDSSFKTKPVITLTSFILSSLLSSLSFPKGIVPDPCERDCSVYLILLPSLTIPLISLSLSTSAVAVATLHLDAAAAPVSIAISCPWFGCFGLSYFRGGGLPCAYACGGDSKSRAGSE